MEQKQFDKIVGDLESKANELIDGHNAEHCFEAEKSDSDAYSHRKTEHVIEGIDLALKHIANTYCLNYAGLNIRQIF